MVILNMWRGDFMHVIRGFASVPIVQIKSQDFSRWSEMDVLLWNSANNFILQYRDSKPKQIILHNISGYTLRISFVVCIRNPLYRALKKNPHYTTEMQFAICQQI